MIDLAPVIFFCSVRGCWLFLPFSFSFVLKAYVKDNISRTSPDPCFACLMLCNNPDLQEENISDKLQIAIVKPGTLQELFR